MNNRIDYIIKVPEERLTELLTFIKNLQSVGLKITLDDTFSLFTISFPDELVKRYAEIHDIDIEHEYFFLLRYRPLPFTIFSTNVRQFQIREKGKCTSCERIFMLNQILETTKFGNGKDDYSLTKLQRLGYVLESFPVHDDGPNNWRELKDDDLNDRQILAKYWANLAVWYREQPLDLIEKYYGSEVAFYFAFMDFFNNMLLFASAISVSYFVISLFIFWASPDSIS